MCVSIAFAVYDVSDGLPDNEEIKLKLDPSKASSDGKTKDAERTISQRISSDSFLLKDINSIALYDI